MVEIDLPGRVRNLRLAHRHGLQPVFEAITNSIHAIEDCGVRPGRVDVHIHRDRSQTPLEAAGEFPSGPILGFDIIDNGIGFGNGNWKAFRKSDTRAKEARGGKGLGRLTWLKVFDDASIISVFTEGNRLWRRAFRFALPEGVSEETLTEVQDQSPGSQVNLRWFRPEYREACPKSARAIAQRVMEHFLEFLVLESCPAIVLHDAGEPEALDIGALFRSDVGGRLEKGGFDLLGHHFEILHVLAAGSVDDHHRVLFCADRRTVQSELLKSRLVDLPAQIRLDDSRRAYHYRGYVSGRHLDDTVDELRTRFSGQDPTLFNPDDVPWQTLCVAAADQARRFLEPHMAPIREAKQKQIQNYVRTSAPQYRSFIKHRPEVIDQIPANLAAKDLELELYRRHQAYKAELLERNAEMLSSLGNRELDKVAAFDQDVQKLLEEWTEDGAAELARYVASRKAILAFLDASFGLQENGRYSREEVIHRVICPLKTTSDDIAPDRMNLWLIDERLSFHRYLASDLPMRDIEVLDSQSERRGDVIIFHGPTAFVDSPMPFSAITILEFKRPARNDYSGVDNPIQQVYDYVEKIRHGQARDHRGRPITIPDRLPFHAYIMCDLTPTLLRQARDARLDRFPEGDGFFGFHPDLGVYLEVISYSRLLSNAKKRNAVLFDRLGLPTLE